jgi:hypothetical protein
VSTALDRTSAGALSNVRQIGLEIDDSLEVPRVGLAGTHVALAMSKENGAENRQTSGRKEGEEIMTTTTLTVRTGLQGGKTRRLSVRTGLQAGRRR